MKVVVGLGNPGRQYAGTRHNVGFDVADYLAAAPAVGPFRSRFQAQIAEWTDDTGPVLLMKPETFMNLSGRSVRQVVDFYKLGPADLLIVCDDITLPLGKLRARSKGSHGGHNGLRSIQEQLGTTDYARLRIGVGEPDRHAGEDATVNHVLGRFRPGERAVVEEAVAAAAQGVLLWLRQGIEACMNRLNGPAPNEQRKAKKTQPEADSPRPNEPDTHA